MNRTAPMLELVPGQIDVWFAVPDSPQIEKLIPAYEALLADDEREQYTQLKLQEHRQEYLVSRALLRTTLSAYTSRKPADWHFIRNRFGKPELHEAMGIDLQFNVAHTCGLVACAVTRRGTIGIDVEYHANSKALLEVADHYFSSVEIADLQALPESIQDQHFFRYWTLKESFIKAKGEGLSIPLESFSFRFEKEAISFIPPEEGLQNAEQWSFRMMKPSANYTAALAYNAEIEQLRLFESLPLSGSRQLSDASELFELGFDDTYQRGIC